MKSDRRADQHWIEDVRARNLAATEPKPAPPRGECPECQGLCVVSAGHAGKVWMPCPRCVERRR